MDGLGLVSKVRFRTEGEAAEAIPPTIGWGARRWQAHLRHRVHHAARVVRAPVALLLVEHEDAARHEEDQLRAPASHERRSSGCGAVSVMLGLLRHPFSPHLHRLLHPWCRSASRLSRSRDCAASVFAKQLLSTDAVYGPRRVWRQQCSRGVRRCRQVVFDFTTRNNNCHMSPPAACYNCMLLVVFV